VEIHRLLSELPVWAYFVLAPLFTVGNLVIAAGIVNQLKRRTAQLQPVPLANDRSKNVNRTLAINYTLLSGFAGVTLYVLVHLSSVSWGG
jgi:hypothetical protein